MAYKDKDRQREADRERQKRRRDKIKAQSVTTLGVIGGVTDTKRRYISKGVTKGSTSTSTSDGSVTKSDGKGGWALEPLKPKRGKDIKCFADLPPDVQATINRASESNEEKAKRTAAAIRYQHLFPDSLYCPNKEQVLKLARTVNSKL